MIAPELRPGAKNEDCSSFFGSDTHPVGSGAGRLAFRQVRRSFEPKQRDKGDRVEHTISNHNTFVQPTFKSFPNYHPTHGVKFEFGFFYKGFDHYHWSKVYFSNFYGCRVYYCPHTLVEYYWCPWDNCFYPVTYKPYGRFVF